MADQRDRVKLRSSYPVRGGDGTVFHPLTLTPHQSSRSRSRGLVLLKSARTTLDQVPLRSHGAVQPPDRGPSSDRCQQVRAGAAKHPGRKSKRQHQQHRQAPAHDPGRNRQRPGGVRAGYGPGRGGVVVDDWWHRLSDRRRALQDIRGTPLSAFCSVKGIRRCRNPNEWGRAGGSGLAGRHSLALSDAVENLAVAGSLHAGPPSADAASALRQYACPKLHQMLILPPLGESPC